MNDLPASDPLGPALRETEAEVAKHLHEACATDAHDISEETTGELMRLEDSLLSAARATERAIALRQERKASRKDRTAAPREPSRTPTEEFGNAVREFRDAAGRAWRAWAVTPGRVRTVRDPQRDFGDYRDGWLAFESLEGGARKRLPHYPADWLQLEDEALGRLLEAASEVTRRREND